MKFIFITLIFAVPAHASDLNTRFLETTKLVEGQYELVRGNNNCQQGPLKVIDLQTELTLMLGANPLVRGIGLENSVTRERDCTTTVTGQFQGQKISGLVQFTCAKLGSAKTEVEVIINDHEITYTRLFSRGKKKQKESCVLKHTQP